MQRLKVGLIVPGFSASEDDWCIPALLVLVRLLARQAEVHVFPLRYPYTQAKYSISGATVHPLGGARATGFRRVEIIRAALATIRDEHRRDRFHLLHAFWADEPGVVAVLSGWRLRIPSLVSLAGGEIVGFKDIGYGGQLNPLNRWMIRLAAKRATRLTAGSRYLSDLAAERLPGAKPGLLPLGVDTAMFSPATDRDGSFNIDRPVRLLHAASLIPVKDQMTLLDALALVNREAEGFHLDIVGDGPLRGALEIHANKAGLEDRVSFHGSKRYDQMPAYFRAADLFVLSSRHEAQGMVILEAGASGRLTVGTAVGVANEVSPPSCAVPVGESTALAAALVAQIQDRSSLIARGDDARCVVNREFAADRTTAETLAVYRKLIGR